LAPTAPPGAASRAGAATLEVPVVVTAGQAVVLRWSALPAQVEELEIVLSLDGGSSYHVRVSPELEGREREYRWCVPDLPTRHARLMLRVGGGEGERMGAVSREFRIEHAGDAPQIELGFHEGQFWTGIEPLHGLAGVGLARDVPRFEDLVNETPCTSPEPGLRCAPPVVLRALGAGAVPLAGRQGRHSGAAPREVPLRI
jgi:hypothetical protein